MSPLLTRSVALHGATLGKYFYVKQYFEEYFNFHLVWTEFARRLDTQSAGSAEPGSAGNSGDAVASLEYKY